MWPFTLFFSQVSVHWESVRSASFFVATVPWEYSSQVLVPGFISFFLFFPKCFRVLSLGVLVQPHDYHAWLKLFREVPVSSLSISGFQFLCFCNHVSERDGWVVVFLEGWVTTTGLSIWLLLAVRLFGASSSRVLAVAASYTVCHDNLLFLEGLFFFQALVFYRLHFFTNCIMQPFYHV